MKVYITVLILLGSAFSSYAQITVDTIIESNQVIIKKTWEDGIVTEDVIPADYWAKRLLESHQGTEGLPSLSELRALEVPNEYNTLYQLELDLSEQAASQASALYVGLILAVGGSVVLAVSESDGVTYTGLGLSAIGLPVFSYGALRASHARQARRRAHRLYQMTKPKE
jgi:hypothetical protein